MANWFFTDVPKQLNREKTDFITNVAEKSRNKTHVLLFTYTEINLK